MKSLPPGGLSPSARRAVRGAALLLAVAITAAGVYVLAAYPPTPTSWYPGCQFHTLTGLHCPGCGTTRALHALLNGRFVQSLAYNPLIYFVLPVVGWWAARSLWAWWQVMPPPEPGRSATRVGVALTVVMLAFWVLRNLPAWPFTLLAPHEL